MTFSISNRLEHTRAYEKNFAEIEANLNLLQVDSMGISDTTLEEIFIKLAKEPKKNTFAKRSFNVCGLDLVDLATRVCSPVLTSRILSRRLAAKKEATLKLTDEQSKLYSTYTKFRVRNKTMVMIQQLSALLIKRFHRVKRNIKGKL